MIVICKYSRSIAKPFSNNSNGPQAPVTGVKVIVASNEFPCENHLQNIIAI